jgi:hypothetical protein
MQFRLPDMPEIIASFAGDVMIVVQMSLAVCAIILARVVRCTISPTIEGTVWTNVARYASAVDRQRHRCDRDR